MSAESILFFQNLICIHQGEKKMPPDVFMVMNSMEVKLWSDLSPTLYTSIVVYKWYANYIAL